MMHDMNTLQVREEYKLERLAWWRAVLKAAPHMRLRFVGTGDWCHSYACNDGIALSCSQWWQQAQQHTCCAVLATHPTYLFAFTQALSSVRHVSTVCASKCWCKAWLMSKCG
jgi:hypothetical protein